MNLNFSTFILLTALFFSCASPPESQSLFFFTENGQGVELLEDGQPVFFYQRAPKSLNGEYICNHYIHPLYSIDGDTLTEEFPADHPYHRGIFWAWHQLFVGEQRVGDGWIMKNFSHDVVAVQTKADKKNAQIDLSVLWKSPDFQNGEPFMEEHTTITVHHLQANVRKIDFEIALQPLVPEVSIGGSEDEKGYGGFCVRLRMPDGLIFTAKDGPVTPQTLQLHAGPWMDFSAPYGNPDNYREGEVSGLTLLCHPGTPNYPAPWILRQKSSMQNIVFPGEVKIELSMNKPTVLRYRLIIHRGNAASVDIAKWQTEYAGMYVKDPD